MSTSDASHAKFEELWSKLVPASGQATTIRGELVRSIGRMSDEFARNGYANWDIGYEILSAFLVLHLTDGTFGPQTSAGIKKDVEMVTRYARREKVDHDLEEAHMRLQEAVVAWCDRHPSPVTHTTNPNLKR